MHSTIEVSVNGLGVNLRWHEEEREEEKNATIFFWKKKKKNIPNCIDILPHWVEEKDFCNCRQMGARGSQQAKKNVSPSKLIPNSNESLETTNEINRIELTSPLKMPMSNIYKCGRCGMIFSTDEGLYKHRTRYCIGAMSSSTGRLNYSDDEDLNQTTARTRLKYSSPIDKVIEICIYNRISIDFLG